MLYGDESVASVSCLLLFCLVCCSLWFFANMFFFFKSKVVRLWFLHLGKKRKKKKEKKKTIRYCYNGNLIVGYNFRVFDSSPRTDLTRKYARESHSVSISVFINLWVYDMSRCYHVGLKVSGGPMNGPHHFLLDLQFLWLEIMHFGCLSLMHQMVGKSCTLEGSH